MFRHHVQSFDSYLLLLNIYSSNAACLTALVTSKYFYCIASLYMKFILIHLDI